MKSKYVLSLDDDFVSLLNFLSLTTGWISWILENAHKLFRGKWT